MSVQPARRQLRRILLRGAFALVVTGGLGPAATAQVVSSKHNLSTSGPGTIKSTTETEVCKFCHIPHKAIVSSPIWGHQLSTATYTPYASGTLTSSVTSTVTGATRLCLSCHDGQVAVNALGNGAAPTMSGGTTFVSGASNIGTNLSADHPVSFTPDTLNNREIVSPQSSAKGWGTVHLDKSGVLQCTACHDAHKYDRDATTQKFLETSNQNSAICTTCHAKNYWATYSAHRTASVSFTSSQGQHTGYTTAAGNGCEMCHKPHKASQAKQVLNGSEEATCVGCHVGSPNGGNTRSNVSNSSGGPFTKTYVHPTFTTSGKHNPVTLSPRTSSPSESANDLAGTTNQNRHAECQDCHNPHAAGTRSAVSGNHYNSGTSFTPTNAVSASLDLTGVWGVEPGASAAWTAPLQSGYTRQDPATYEYQICFKCHSGYAYGATPPTALSSGNNGVTSETDQALEFNPNNPSYHAVAANAVAGVRGSYNGPWTATSKMYCTDCHGSNDGSSGWSVPSVSGPHGSSSPFILRGGWTTGTGSGTPGDLCFRCHSYSAAQNGTSNTKFSKSNYTGDLHSKHVFALGKKCMNCHSAVVHGWKRASLIVYVNDGAPYEVVGTAKIVSWTRNSGNYDKTNCTTVANGGCH